MMSADCACTWNRTTGAPGKPTRGSACAKPSTRFTRWTFMAPDPELFIRLRSVVGAENLLAAKEDLIAYSFDGTAAMQQLPGCVVFPRTREHVCGVLKVARAMQTAVVTRGSGTGLSGGSLPSGGSIVLCTVKMNQILEVDRANLTILVEPGVSTLQVADAATSAALFYPP